MQESGWPNLTRNIMKGICQRSDVRGVISIITIPSRVLSKSPPKALSSLMSIIIWAISRFRACR